MYEQGLFNYETEDTLTNSQQWCNHEWKKTTLIISTVSDCVKCGVKKEDYDKYNEPPKWTGDTWD